MKKQINERPGADADEEDKEEFVPVCEQAHIQFEIQKVADHANMVFV